MSAKQTLLAVVVVAMCFLNVSLSAQEQKNELTGMIGRIFISDQGIQGATYLNPTIHSGKGLTFEVNYSRWLFTTPIFGLSGEVPAVFNLDEDLNAGYSPTLNSGVVPANYKEIFVTPALRLNLFPATAVSPWVSFGGGFGRFSESKNLLYSGTNPAGSSTTGVIQGGVGLDLNPFQHRFREFGFRGEARDFWSGEPNFPLAPTGKSRQHNYFVGGGVMWHF